MEREIRIGDRVVHKIKPTFKGKVVGDRISFFKTRLLVVKSGTRSVWRASDFELDEVWMVVKLMRKYDGAEKPKGQLPWI